MGIKGLLPHLPGGECYRYSFFEQNELKDQTAVPFDAAGALWQFAAAHPADFLRGNYNPSLVDWTRFLNYLRSICRWKLVVYLDGKENIHKEPEKQRRERKAQKAREENNLRGQIRNNPAYLAKAAEVCKFLSIEVRVSSDEADPQVAYHALTKSLIAVTGDSDLLAYGPADTAGGDGEQLRLGKLMIVKLYKCDIYRIIDLETPTEVGKYPLYDLYCKYGRIVFQLYAACSGCDFTQHGSGIPGFGIAKFIPSIEKLDGPPTASSLANVIWNDHNKLAEDAGFQSEGQVEQHLQNIVDIFTSGKLYDAESNIISMDGSIIEESTEQSKLHMHAKVDSRTGEAHDESLLNEIESMNIAQFLHCSLHRRAFQ